MRGKKQNHLQNRTELTFNEIFRKKIYYSTWQAESHLSIASIFFENPLKINPKNWRKKTFSKVFFFDFRKPGTQFRKDINRAKLSLPKFCSWFSKIEIQENLPRMFFQFSLNGFLWISFFLFSGKRRVSAQN